MIFTTGISAVARRRIAGASSHWSANGATLDSGDASLVAVWNLEDVNDSKGSNTLTNNGTVTFTVGKHNNAGTFNGSSQYLSIADSNDWDFGTGEFGISLWINQNGGTGNYLVINHGGYGTWADGAGWCILSFGDNRLLFRVYSDASTYPVDLDVSGLSSYASNWHHVLINRNSGGVITMYLDGSSIDTQTYSSTLSYGTDSLKIATSRDNGNYFREKIDAVYIWKGYCPDASALYNSGTGAFWTP